MKKSITALVCVLCLYVFVGNVFAQSVTIDLTKLPPEYASKIMEAKQLADNPPKPVSDNSVKVKEMEEFVTLGEKVVVVLKTICEELSFQVNEFIKTPVGKFLMIVITFKVFGDTVWHIFGGTAVWVVITFLILLSFKKFHVPVKITDDDKNIRFIKPYDFSSSDARAMSVVFHVIGFVVLTVWCLTIVF